MIVIFFILIVISLPFFIGGRPLTIPELMWMVVGERMSEGATLYVDVWSNISPFSASAYWLIDAVFGRSHLVYQIAGLVLVIIQSAIFNNTMLQFKAYNENNYIPAFIYMLLMTSHFDFFTLSPLLMSMTILLHVMHLLFGYIQMRVKDDEMLLKIGVYLGVAVLFYLPVFLIVIVILLSLLFFTGVSVRRILLLFYSFFLPLLIVGAYYYFKDGTKAFFIQYLFSYFNLKSEYLISLRALLIISIIPAIFLILSVLKVFGSLGFTNFQVRIQQMMLMFLMIGGFVFLLSQKKTPYQLAIFVPPAAFFISHFFLLIKRRLWTELSFGIFFLSIVIINWGAYFNNSLVNLTGSEKLLLQESSLDQVVKDKRILVLGDDISLYQNAKLATPYFDWKLAKSHFENLDYYDNITAIFRNLTNDPPDLIIDKGDLMPTLSDKIPILKTNYTKSGPVYRKR